MSEHKHSIIQTALFAGLPILLLLILDFFALFLQMENKAIPHLAIAVLSAQLISVLVFAKGQICLGQRSRLAKVNIVPLLFWGCWFFLSLFSNYHFPPTDLICLMGIGLVVATSTQPKEPKVLRASLIMAGTVGILGCLSYLLIFFVLPLESFLPYNIFAQILVGIILANLFLVISKNRLQGFIALLPLAMLTALFLNALTALGLLIIQAKENIFINQFSLIFYFALHLLIALILAIHIFKKWKLEFSILVILLFIAASLPIWSLFARIY